MATVAAIQAALDATGKGAQIVAGPLFTQSATLDQYQIRGGADGTVGRVNRTLVVTTRTDSAAVQAAAMLSALQTRR